MTVQTAVRELYEASGKEEKLSLLAEIGAFLGSIKNPSYPSK